MLIHSDLSDVLSIDPEAREREKDRYPSYMISRSSLESCLNILVLPDHPPRPMNHN